MTSTKPVGVGLALIMVVSQIVNVSSQLDNIVSSFDNVGIP